MYSFEAAYKIMTLEVEAEWIQFIDGSRRVLVTQSHPQFTGVTWTRYMLCVRNQKQVLWTTVDQAQTAADRGQQ